LRRSRRVPRVQKVRGRDVPAAVAAIAIAIAGDVVADAVREAVREVTVVAIPAVADAEEGRIVNPAPEGRTNLAQRFSAGKVEQVIQVPEGRPSLTHILLPLKVRLMLLAVMSY